jgi:cobalamin synthase
MIGRAKAVLRQLMAWPHGRRFRNFHRTYAERCSGWTRIGLMVAALVSFLIGVVLAFIPGPAVVFFALTCALLAVLSPWAARRFDVLELYLKRYYRRFRRWRARRREARARRSLRV